MRSAPRDRRWPERAARSWLMFFVAALVVVVGACGLLTAALATRDEVCEPSDPAAPILRLSGIYMLVLVLVVLVLGLAVRARRLPDGWWMLGLACVAAFVIVLVAANVMPDRMVDCPL